MKHLKTFESVNEGFRLEKDETVLGSMNIKFPEDMPGADYTLDIIHLMDDGDEYVVIPNNYSRSASDGNTVWIPKDQWPEFKKLIDRIRPQISNTGQTKTESNPEQDMFTNYVSNGSLV